MAKLPQSTGGTGLQITELAPAGQHIAVCLRINDQFGVERPTFENPQIKETVDVTRFVFGLIAQDGRPYLVQTYEFSISGAPGANLMKFLTAWNGSTPQIGWDYCAMLNTGAQLTIQHKMPRKAGGSPYASISGIAPVHPQLQQLVPNAAQFEPLLRALEANSQRPAPTGAAQPPPPGPTRSYPPAGSPPPYAPPTPPAPPAPPAPAYTPPPPAPVAKFWVSNNGQTREVTMQDLIQLANSGGGAVPAIKEGETAWRTVSAYASVPPAGGPPPAPGFPPANPPVPGQPPLPGAQDDDQVPF